MRNLRPLIGAVAILAASCASPETYEARDRARENLEAAEELDRQVDADPNASAEDRAASDELVADAERDLEDVEADVADEEFDSTTDVVTFLLVIAGLGLGADQWRRYRKRVKTVQGRR